MYSIFIPTYNAGSVFENTMDSLLDNKISISHVFVVDSGSTDTTLVKAKKLGFICHTISKTDFNHGATRQLALTLCPDADIIIYMTQDSILASPDSIKNILAPFEDEKVGAVCGRQLPHKNASPIAAHARLFNYPAISSIKSQADIPRLGIKAAFLSNSFAAYRRTALEDVGGFPSDAILSEDTFVATKMLLSGWKIAYAADATCYHSHNYNIFAEFKRYFDIGIFHGREKWYLASLGRAEGEGKKFVFSELRYLLKRAPWFIPSAIIRTCLKLLGYKLGQREQIIPLSLKQRLSMNKGYWK